METPPPTPNSQLVLRSSEAQLTTATAATDAEKAWHFLALLLSHGRPAELTDLSSKCTLFYSNPDSIRFLCSIPNSPIRLTHNYVTVSQTGLESVAHFFKKFDEIVTVMDSPRCVPRLLKDVSSRNIVTTYCRKRKRLPPEIEIFSEKRTCYIHDFDEEKKVTKMPLTMGAGMQNIYSRVLGGNSCRRHETKSNYSSVLEIDCQELERAMFASPVSTDSTLRILDHEFINVEYGYIEIKDEALNLQRTGCQSNSHSHDRFPYLEAIPEEKLVKSVSVSELYLQNCKISEPETCNNGMMDVVNSITNINHGTSSWLGMDQRITFPQSANGATTQACDSLADDENGNSDEVLLHNSNRWHLEDLPINASHIHKDSVDDAEKFPSEVKKVACNVGKLRTEVNQQCQGGCLKDQVKSASTPKVHKKNSTLREKKCQIVDYMCNSPHTELNPIKPKTKQNRDREMNGMGKRETTTENRKRAPSIPISNDIEQKPFPDFDSFVVEEEEGSGGYGTVYRARRKSDGVTFAIKCPHVKANRNHVHNELKMLQRVGGKNCVIKYEGSFKIGDFDYLVLEHVKHDRPEILKREINIFQLQWYGYCMFRALAGLHKQGIVHRDVKPGNFLFSRSVNKGFLIDFNLALDLHKRQRDCEIPKSAYNLNTGRVSLPQTKSLAPTKDRQSIKTSFPDPINDSAGKGSKSFFPPGILKKVNQSMVLADSNCRSINKSQGADGSGITSAKDATTTRTPSAERLRQPLPSIGRKELISWAHEALQGSGNYEPVHASTPTRKRVAAPRQTQATDRKCFYPTPMPLYATGMAINGSGLLNGNGNHRREGSCAGTKGFRAPEVLFKSVHQGPKVDIWSAGVTLLYLMIGRTPFTGEPDQNIKGIAKLRGGEDLWEVAKLHNQETLFPQELFDIKHLSPVKLKDWCARNTRRPDFHEVTPRSLFDLVDKCLTVNPRLRISAEEALRHEFFAPCHEVLRKQRLQKQVLSVDSGIMLPLSGESQPCELN